jgi:hypothetical protein
MQQNFRKELETKYDDLYKTLYVQWKQQSKLKYEELQEKGLINSGIGIKELYKLIETLINQTLSNLQSLFENIQISYNRKISLKDLEQYKEKSKKNINEHIVAMHKEIKEKYKNDKLLLTESNEIYIKNLKNNSNNKIDRIHNEIVNLRKGKKIEGLVIFNVVFTLLGFVVGVASLIIGIIALIK